MKSSAHFALVLLSAIILATCGPSPAAPTTTRPPVDNETIVGQMAVAFLNRFATSSVSPAACVIDFTEACRGKREELIDIEYNRAHFQILGARFGAPVVRFTSAGGADVSIPCAYDSRNIKCETPDCVVGSVGYVSGTCLLTSVREPGGWRLCTSNFSGTTVTPPARLFFGKEPLRTSF